MGEQAVDSIPGYILRLAQSEDCPSARAFMLATFERDFGYGYVAKWHQDTDDLQGFYLDNPRQTRFIAIDEQSGKVVATTGIRTGGPRAGAHPDWLVSRYTHERTAEIIRVYVDPAHRRHGLAQALVRLVCQWVRQEGGYEVICLHTNANIPGAEAFWRAMPTIETYAEGPEGREVEGRILRTIHFEIPLK